MSKTKQNKDYRNMGITEAVQWTRKNCMFEDVRMRIASRQVAYVLLNELANAGRYIQELEAKLKLAQGE